MKVVIFPNEDLSVSIMVLAPEYEGMIEEIAERDVPEGRPWRIVDASDLPPREVRDRWRWTNEGPLDVGPEPEKPVPQSMTFSQFLIGLVAKGWITQEDGDSWLSGVLPPAVVATINLLPADRQFAAKARAVRPSDVLRSDPLVQMMALAQGRATDEIDDLFRTYATV